MRIVINGQELHLPPTPGGLLISLHLEPGGEEFGPCVIDVYGGTLRLKGNASNPNAMTVRSMHEGVGIMMVAGPAPFPIDITSGPLANDPAADRCRQCWGVGHYKRVNGDRIDDLPCPRCLGTGRRNVLDAEPPADQATEVKAPRGGFF